MTAAVRASTCSACGASIRFLQTPAGKWLPCDSRRASWWLGPRAPRGARIAVVVDDAGQVHRGEVLDAPADGAREVSGFTPHWGSCAGAQEFRRGA